MTQLQRVRYHRAQHKHHRARYRSVLPGTVQRAQHGLLALAHRAIARALTSGNPRYRGVASRAVEKLVGLHLRYPMAGQDLESAKGLFKEELQELGLGPSVRYRVAHGSYQIEPEHRPHLKRPGGVELHQPGAVYHATYTPRFNGQYGTPQSLGRHSSMSGARLAIHGHHVDWWKARRKHYHAREAVGADSFGLLTRPRRFTTMRIRRRRYLRNLVGRVREALEEGNRQFTSQRLRHSDDEPIRHAGAMWYAARQMRRMGHPGWQGHVKSTLMHLYDTVQDVNRALRSRRITGKGNARIYNEAHAEHLHKLRATAVRFMKHITRRTGVRITDSFADKRAYRAAHPAHESLDEGCGGKRGLSSKRQWRFMFKKHPRLARKMAHRSPPYGQLPATAESLQESHGARRFDSPEYHEKMRRAHRFHLEHTHHKLLRRARKAAWHAHNTLLQSDNPGLRYGMALGWAQEAHRAFKAYATRDRMGSGAWRYAGTIKTYKQLAKHIAKRLSATA